VPTKSAALTLPNFRRKLDNFVQFDDRGEHLEDRESKHMTGDESHWGGEKDLLGQCYQHERIHVIESTALKIVFPSILTRSAVGSP
jgi:hypothetical protein